MGRIDFRRTASALSGAAGAGALSYALGAPWIALLPALLSGGLAAWLLAEHQDFQSSGADDMADSFESTRALLVEVMQAFSDPLLFVERQQVTIANEAALALLGAHIVGEDVRLAIRHPGVAERLTGQIDAAREPSIQLVGIGDAERRWELRTHDMGDQRRLVHLSDRTSSYIAEKMRVDFVANASHELRTPLATLVGFIETLEDGKAAEDKKTRERFLKIMSDEARRMQRLIDDLISLSRIEADKFSPPDRAVTLAPLIAEVIEAAGSGLENQGRGRIIVAPVDPDLFVMGDRAQLSQLLHNLIGNALKYGRPEGPVRIKAEATPEGIVHIAVTDEGDGIALEHLPRLTERFYRVDPSRSRAMGGTGLGLAIVKHIVERHRGRLDIRSRIGEGTMVSVLLPAAPDTLS
jgi:two-component system phosphate regulon sensor histidine kinase PhoR